MKFVYLQNDDRVSMAYLVVSQLIKEIQESDLEWYYEGETAIKLNRFLYNADPKINIMLFVKWDEPETELVYRRYDKVEEEHLYKTAGYIIMSQEEKEKLFDTIASLF